MWKHRPTIESLDKRAKGTMSMHLGIEFVEITDQSIKARMPVNEKTKQPMGALHGGASVALAETLGSIAAIHCVDASTKTIVGLEINANHIKKVTEGWVYGEVKSLHLGRTTQVWQIEIRNESGDLVSISRLTVAVLEK